MRPLRSTLIVGTLLALTACGSSKEARRNAIGRAVVTSSQHVETARTLGDQSAWAKADEMAAQNLEQILTTRTMLQSWMVDARDSIGAIRETSPRMLQPLAARLHAIEAEIEQSTPLFERAFQEHPEWNLRMREFLSLAKTLIDARQQGYAREQHAQYESMVNAWQAWVEEDARAIEAFRLHPERLAFMLEN